MHFMASLHVCLLQKHESNHGQRIWEEIILNCQTCVLYHRRMKHFWKIWNVHISKPQRRRRHSRRRNDLGVTVNIESWVTALWDRLECNCSCCYLLILCKDLRINVKCEFNYNIPEDFLYSNASDYATDVICKIIQPVENTTLIQLFSEIQDGGQSKFDAVLLEKFPSILQMFLKLFPEK